MRIIGMLSGTSYDAIDALVADLFVEGTTLVCDLVAHDARPYPDAVRAAIAGVLPPATTTTEQICRLDVEIGHLFGGLARSLAETYGPVDAVCSHGQTVYYLVGDGGALGTLQLGEPAFIAEATGAAVVSDVRNRDIAAGGFGAPLASLLDVLLLPADGPTVYGSLNLGGIANVTVLGAGRAPVAFDIGPANALIDAAVEWVTNGREHFDRDGALAASGRADAGLVERLADHPYFLLPPPKATGKELFNLGYVTERLGTRELAPSDLVRSITEATATVLADALARAGVEELVVAGGGTRNPVLMAALGDRMPGVGVRLVDEFGVAEAAKEALIFAVIGFLTLHGLPGTVPSCTGASRARVLGAVTPGERPLSVAPAGVAPTRLVIRTPLFLR